jgi:hypothetical protein
MLDLIMKCSYIILLIALFPNPTFSDTIFLKDGTNFSTSIYWEESKGKIGYFRDGKSIYISKDLIDWNKTEEKRTLIKTNKSKMPSQPQNIYDKTQQGN